jgi:drug/metabolite transporter (DMT)-like permease
VLFGALPVAGKVALKELSPLVVAAVRSASAALVFLIVRALTRPEKIVHRRDWGRLLLLSVLGVSANQGLFIEGLSRTSAVNAQLMGTSIPALVVAAALLLGRERPSSLKVAGIALAGVGALSLIGVERFQAGAAIGDALVLCNSTCYAFYLVLARDLLARYRAVTVATWVFVFGAVPLGIAGALTARGSMVWPAVPVVEALTFLVFGSSVGTYFLNAWALRRASASLVAIYCYCQPVITAVLTAWILHERPSSRSLPAAILIFAGVGLVAWAERRNSPRRAQ